MSENSGNVFIGFGDFYAALSNKKITRTKDGSLKISGTVISNKDFNAFYMNDITSMLSKLETTISPDFAPSTDLYHTLDILSSPVLKETKVPEAVKGFYKKLNVALSSKNENREKFNTKVTEYVATSTEAPVFMLASMDKELASGETPSPFKSLMPTSEKLMEGYGTKYNGEDILSLANDGYIEAKAPITMLVYKSLYAQDEQAENYVKPVSYEELLDFYSPEKHPGRMHTLLQNGELDKNFSDLHSELLENIPKKDRKDYTEDLVQEAKDLASTPSDYSNDLLEYANTSIIPDNTLSGNITSDFLKAKFAAGEISLARLLAIYETDKKYFKGVEALLTPAEIEKAHGKGEIEDRSLMYLPENNRISYLRKNSTPLSTIMYLFLHCNGLSISELQKILTGNHILEDLDSYIDIGSEPSKIKELYENYLIDYGCLKNLVTTGIISEKDFQKYRLSLPRDTVYDTIEQSKGITITGSAHNIPISSTGAFIGATQTTKDTIAKSTEIYRILGGLSEQESVNIPTISHTTERDEEGFLNKYKVLPLKAANLFAFLPPEPTRPTYLMPYQETAYIVHNQTLPDSLLQNSAFHEIKASEKMHEDILRIAFQFEEARNYLEKLGYSENLSYEEAIRLMREEFKKIKIKGEN